MHIIVFIVYNHTRMYTCVRVCVSVCARVRICSRFIIYKAIACSSCYKSNRAKDRRWVASPSSGDIIT